MKIRKKVVLALALAMVLVALADGQAFAKGVKALVSKQGINLDFEDVEIPAYNINDENYFRLRDFAEKLKDTDKKFAVDYDEEKNIVIITEGADYISDPSKLATIQGETAEALENSQKLFINRGGDLEEVAIKSYNINGNNYYRLRDLGKELEIGVAYDSANNMVIIDTLLADISYLENQEDEDENSDDYGYKVVYDDFSAGSGEISMYKSMEAFAPTFNKDTEAEYFLDNKKVSFDEVYKQIESDGTNTSLYVLINHEEGNRLYVFTPASNKYIKLSNITGGSDGAGPRTIERHFGYDENDDVVEFYVSPYKNDLIFNENKTYNILLNGAGIALSASEQ